MLLALAVAASHARNDGTLVPEAKGAEIVEMTVDRIEASCVFPDDKLLLRRLAYVESNDGLHPDAFRNGYYGGIWQVRGLLFALVRSCSLLFTHIGSYSLLFTLIRSYSLLFALVCSYSLLFTLVRCCSLLFAFVRSCSLLFARICSCSLLFARICSCSFLFAHIRSYSPLFACVSTYSLFTHIRTF